MLFPWVLYYDIEKVQQKSQYVESFKLDCGFYKFHPLLFQILTYGGECLSFHFILDLFFLLTRGWINATWVKNIGNSSWALSSVQSYVMSDSLWPYGLQHSRLPCSSPTPGAYSNSRPLSWWCHPTVSFSAIPFSSCLQSFLASGSFPMRWFFESGGQSIEGSASASILPINIQDWFLLGWTGWISLQSKGFSRVFFNSTVQKHQFFGPQLSL